MLTPKPSNVNLGLPFCMKIANHLKDGETGI